MSSIVAMQAVSPEASVVIDALTMLASAFAVIVSLYALNKQRTQSHEISTQTLIHDQYDLCRALDQIRTEHPELSHILALPAQDGGVVWATYEDFRKQVRRLFEDKDRNVAARAAMYLKEHSVALHVFNIYEQTLLQKDLAEKADDKDRIKVLRELTDYYEKHMLRNPRLRYHWKHGGSDMMDGKTRDRYDKYVRQAFADDPTDSKSPIDD